jgi:receptor protein-tyrosine kinase
MEPDMLGRSAKSIRTRDMLIRAARLAREQPDNAAAMPGEHGVRPADAVVEMGVMTTEDAPLLHVAHAAESNRLGDILVNTGKLAREKAEDIAGLQRECGMRFGEAAMHLRLVSVRDLEFALARQYGYACLNRGPDARVSSELVAICQPLGRQAEALRALRSELALRWFAGEPKRSRLAVVSAEAGCGRTYLAANLAVAFAQLGVRTLLIDADMRHPRQHRLFNLDNRFGLSSVLASRGSGSEVIRQASLRGMSTALDLSVLTAGPWPPNPQELLGRKRFSSFLDEVDDAFDVIIFDTPAALDYADAKTIAVRAQGALLATRKHHTGLRHAARLCTALSQLRVTVVGSVLGEF